MADGPAAAGVPFCRALSQRPRQFLFAGAVLGDQVFQPGFELLDLAVNLFGPASEVHVVELGNLQLELLDFEGPYVERLLRRRDGGAQLLYFPVALQQQCLEGGYIVGKGGVLSYARSLRAAMTVYKAKRGVQVRVGCFHSMPSRGIDSCAGVRRILPPVSSGQTKQPC